MKQLPILLIAALHSLRRVAAASRWWRTSVIVIGATTIVGAGQLPPQAPDSVAEGPIRSARAAWNDALARRDTAAFGRVLSPSYHTTNGFGHIVGPEAAMAAAADLLRQRPDLEYVARPTRIRVVASEWEEHWREPTGRTEMRGTYFAVWRQGMDDGSSRARSTCRNHVLVVTTASRLGRIDERDNSLSKGNKEALIAFLKTL
jgi:Domain of unknown function (DUF4440)